MMSKMLAAEWGPYGVRSNCVEPCFVKTPMSANFYADPEVEKSRSRLIATRRIGEVSDIANAVMFLASTPLGLYHRRRHQGRRRLLQHDGRPHRQARRPSRLCRQLP